jgi:hypothetical protein
MDKPVRTIITPKQIRVGSAENITLCNYVLEVPEAKRLTFLLLGSAEKGWMPAAKMVAQFMETVKAGLERPDGIIVSGMPFVSVLQIDIPKGQLVITGTTNVDVEQEAQNGDDSC